MSEIKVGDKVLFRSGTTVFIGRATAVFPALNGRLLCVAEDIDGLIFVNEVQNFQLLDYRTTGPKRITYSEGGKY